MDEQILASGVLTGYENSIKNLEEIIRSQEILIESMQNSMLRLPRLEAVNDITRMAQKCELYTNKLTNLRSQMAQLTDRVAKLKVRADKLRKQREEAIHKAITKQQRIAEFERQLADARLKKKS